MAVLINFNAALFPPSIAPMRASRPGYLNGANGNNLKAIADVIFGYKE